MLSTLLFALALSLQAPLKQDGARKERQGANGTEQNAQNPQTRRVVARPTADERMATYMFWQNIISGSLGIIAAAQLYLLLRQHRDAKRQSIAVFRPHLTVRNVFGATSGNGGVQFLLVNDGGSTARIIEGKATTFVNNDKVVYRNPLTGDHVTDLSCTGKTLAAGESVSVEWANDLLAAHFRYIATQATGTIYFLGFVLYKDENRVKRRTGFCRVFDPESQRFNIVANEPDFEYAD